MSETEYLQRIIKFRDIWLGKLRASEALNKRTNDYKHNLGEMNAWNEAWLILCNETCRKFGWNGCELDLKIDAYENALKNCESEKQKVKQ